VDKGLPEFFARYVAASTTTTRFAHAELLKIGLQTAWQQGDETCVLAYMDKEKASLTIGRDFQRHRLRFLTAFDVALAAGSDGPRFSPNFRKAAEVHLQLLEERAVLLLLGGGREVEDYPEVELKFFKLLAAARYILATSPVSLTVTGDVASEHLSTISQLFESSLQGLGLQVVAPGTGAAFALSVAATEKCELGRLGPECCLALTGKLTDSGNRTVAKCNLTPDRACSIHARHKDSARRRLYSKILSEDGIDQVLVTCVSLALPVVSE